MRESEISAPKEGNETFKGITINYATWGQFSRSERAVLLIHGVTSNCQAWGITSNSQARKGLGPFLAKQGWFVIAPDLRGRGKSSKPPHGYGIPYHADDLLSLCDALGLRSVHVVGHSLGAYITIFLAAMHPERVGRIILVDAGGKIPDDVDEFFRRAGERLGQPYDSLDDFMRKMRQTMEQLGVHEDDWKDFWEGYFRYEAEVHADGKVTLRMPQAAFDEEIAVNSLATTINTQQQPPKTLTDRIQAPTLIVRAEQGIPGCDPGFVLPQDEAENLQKAIAGSSVEVIPEVNHYRVILSVVFNQKVAAFLDGRPV
jgi:pimeloyl-ACP methyl ester carboxylesterase